MKLNQVFKSINVKTFLSFSLPVFLGSVAMAAQNYECDIFELNSNKAKKLFTCKIEEKDEGGMTQRKASYFDIEGNTVFVETAVLKGDQIQRMEVEQKQENATALIEVADKVITFQKTFDGNTKKYTENLKDSFVGPANFSAYLKSNWDKILKGDRLSFRYAVWSRMETVGFDIVKSGEEGSGPNKKIQLKMTASSAVIRLLVDPVFFKYNEDGTKILELSGRVAPKFQKNGKWKDLDADVVYRY